MIKNPIQILVSLITRKGLEYFNKFYGVYYGYVLQNEDPKNLGRLYVYIPEVNGPVEKGIWAVPMGLWSEDDCGCIFLPSIGQRVFIMYRFGNAQFPVWTFAGHTLKPNPNPNLPEPISGRPETFKDTTAQGLRFKNKVTIITKGEGDETEVEVNHPDDSGVKVTKDQVIIKYKGEDRLVIKDGEILINGGNNGGLINIDRLVTRLNVIEKNFNSHVHYGVTAGNSTTGSASSTLFETTKEYLEDTKVKH